MPKIRIIDDDKGLAEDLALMLENAGHQTAHTDNEHNAITDLLEDIPDLIILDVMFPDNPVAGFDLARIIRQTQEIQTLPIILLTGVNQEFPADFSVEDIDPDWMPVQAFFEKPPPIQELLAKIDELLA
jgi:CheY-like chemotaxis protein